MKIIRYQSEAQAEALQARLHNRLNGKKVSMRYNASRYANPIQHPTENDYGVLLDESKVDVYNDIMLELTAGEKNNTEAYSDSWKSDSLV